ncbi:MAG: PTS transporter subunit EIIC [Faecalibacterium sp.]|jgi:PTS system N-acetylglucosamine-specific IIC component|nr:PTS transporter subunit EIIC [Faecalibacterium sp.]
MKKFWKAFITNLSKLGRAMLIPIVAMPAVGILGRLGAADMLNIPLMETASNAITGNLDMLFAFGACLAFAKSKDKTYPMIGAAAGLFAFKACLTSLNPDIGMGVFAGIVVGTLAAILYNYSREWKTPEMFSFFTGDRFIIVLAPICAIPLALLFNLVWPPIQNGLDSLAMWLASSGVVGIFLFGFLNRALIPVGLHHVINSYLWFQMGSFTTAAGEVVTGDIPRFLAGDPTAGVFMTGLYPVFLFGLPGACFAMYKAAKKEKKAETKSLMISGAATTFVAGITEPVEFMFEFVSPKLYLLHCLYSGLGGAIFYFMNVRLGISYNVDIIDYVLNFNLGSNAIWILPVGILFFFLYYFSFKWVIEHDNIKTPGRTDDDTTTAEITEDEKNFAMNATNIPYLAKKLIENLGGKGNVVSVENCITRLRIEVKDGTAINEEKIRQTGVKGLVKLTDTNIQIVIGKDVQAVKDAMNDLL